MRPEDVLEFWFAGVDGDAPPPPHRYDEPVKPYVIGVVDLDAGLRVVGQMVDGASEVAVGCRVELVIAPLFHEGDRAVTSWKFKRI